ncbi:hypothetical protein [Staphylococcus epidermidis]|uniref:hypothetical protein n=1 Tax=Staphylococcus epidermidis TaxID=1282 RepID=UPI00130095D9|nr:hypothetical protein [Staphylococcus epidermidis]
MSTASFTTHYGFNEEDAQKLIDAIEKSEKTKINKSEIKAKIITNKNDIKNLMETFSE